MVDCSDVLRPKKTNLFKRFMNRYQDGPVALNRSKYLTIFLFTIIPIISFFVFYVGTVYYTFFLTFTEVIGIDKYGNEITKFSLDNFSKAFQLFVNGGSDLRIALSNTFTLFLVNTIHSVFIFVIAYAFSKNLRGAKFFRFSLFIPSIISTLALSVVVKAIIASDGFVGIIYNNATGKVFPALFYEEATAWPTLLAYCIWAGFYQNLLLYEGALRRVPSELTESARLDGANGFQEFFYVTLPCIWETISTLLILRFSGLFTINAPILLFTDGAYNTQTLSFWFYQQVQYNNSTHVSAAVGMIITIINLPIVFVVRFVTGKISKMLGYQ